MHHSKTVLKQGKDNCGLQANETTIALSDPNIMELDNSCRITNPHKHLALSHGMTLYLPTFRNTTVETISKGCNTSKCMEYFTRPNEILYLASRNDRVNLILCRNQTSHYGNKVAERHRTVEN